jgi:exopolysaccharide biosynthesis polyprenyl glycosylphosphotransferase
MSELFLDTVSAAEMAVINEDIRVRGYVERLLGDPDEVQSGNDEERAYLAILLDSIGLRDESSRILQDATGPGQVNGSAALRNTEGMLAAARGDYERAQRALRDALQAAGSSPVLRVKIEANLAAVSWEAGARDVAETWADAASAQQEGRTPASDVLIASIRAAIASAKGDLRSLRAASASLRDASAARVAELGPSHPQALATVANMARIEITLAHAEGSQTRLERATEVLEIAAFRLAAELGAAHPLSALARDSLSAAGSEHADLADPAMQASAAESGSDQAKSLAVGGTGRKATRGTRWRRAERRSTSMPDRAAATLSTGTPVKVGLGLGAVRQEVPSPSGSVAVAAWPAFRGGTVVQTSNWTRTYLRRAVAADFGCAVAVATVSGLTLSRDTPTSFAVINVALPVLWLMALGLTGVYRVSLIGTGSDEFRKVLDAGLGLTAGLVLACYAAGTGLSREYLLFAVPSITALSLVVRLAVRKRLHRRRARGQCMSTVIAAGHERAVRQLIGELRREPHHGLMVVAACLPAPSTTTAVAGVRVLGDLDEIADGVRYSGADAVAVLSCPEMDGVKLRSLAWELEKTGAGLFVAPGLLDVTGPRTTIHSNMGLSLLRVDHPQLGGLQHLVKGLFDRSAAALGLILLSPLMLAIAVTIRTSDTGPALFAQTRVGKDGRPFLMYKFRTMVVDAEKRLAELRADNESTGLLFKMRHDPRITVVGARLRKWSLDELPTLINVLKGEMSLVGPRPALPGDVALYADHVRRRLVVKPGLTGMWQVNGRSDLSWEEGIRLDLRYIENWSFALDLQILWKTFSVVFSGAGAY